MSNTTTRLRSLRVRNEGAEAIVEAAETLLHRHLIGALRVFAGCVESITAILQFFGGGLIFSGHFVEYGQARCNIIAAGFGDLAVEIVLAAGGGGRGGGG